MTILGPSDLPAEVPYHASQLYAKNISTFLLAMVRDGKLQLGLGRRGGARDAGGPRRPRSPRGGDGAARGSEAATSGKGVAKNKPCNSVSESLHSRHDLPADGCPFFGLGRRHLSKPARFSWTTRDSMRHRALTRFWQLFSASPTRGRRGVCRRDSRRGRSGQCGHNRRRERRCRRVCGRHSPRVRSRSASGRKGAVDGGRERRGERGRTAAESRKGFGAEEPGTGG